MPEPFDVATLFTAAEIARGAERALVGHAAGLLERVIDALLLVALAVGPLGARLWTACERLGARARPGPFHRVLGERWAAATLFLAVLALLRFLATFPLVVARDFVAARHFGLSHDTFGRFLRTELVYAFVAAVAFALVGAVLGALRRRFPRRWWLAVGLAGAGALVLDTTVEPLWLSVDFTVRPLEGPLVARIDALAEAHGERLGAIVTVDASRRTTRANALVTGFGPTERLVLTDTLVALGEEAVLGAVAHEVGHRRSSRLPLRLAFSAAAFVVFLWLVERLLAGSVRRFAIPEARAMALVVLAVSVVSFALAPLRGWLSRLEEREADALELSVRSDLDAYVQSQVALVRANVMPIEYSAFDALFASHPSPAERIGRALGATRQRSKK